MEKSKTTHSLTEFNAMITAPNTSEYLSRILGERKASFVNNLTALVANNENLQKCKPVTLMYAALKATALDLPLDQNLGYAYVIPYGDVAQFQIGYKGFKQLALRTNMFSCLNVTDVRDGEIALRNRLTGEITFSFIQDEEKRQDAKIIGHVAYFRLQNGFEQMLYMSNEELRAHGSKYSQTFKSEKDYVRKNSKWSTDFDVMAQKTVMKLNLSKNAPLSIELRDAIRFDQAVIEEENKPKYIDNPKEQAQQAVEVLEIDTPKFSECVRALADGATMGQIKAKFEVSEEVELKLIEATFEM